MFVKALAVGLILFTSTPRLCLAQFSSPIYLQAPSQTFDVVSIKQNNTVSPPTSNVSLDRGKSFNPTGGIFRATNQPLIAYLIFAYSVRISETYGGLMSSLPKWAVEDRFDIEGRSSMTNATKEDFRDMVRSVLEDRFKLSYHRESRELPVFLLQLDKKGKIGSQLRSRSSYAPCVSSGSYSGKLPAARLVGEWPEGCGDGDVKTLLGPVRYLAGGRDMDMRAIADWLTGLGDMDRPVVDDTNLSGTFDFVIEYSAPLSSDGPSQQSTTESGPSFLQALKDQLGLRIRRGKAATTFYVVDHVQFPSPN